MKRVRPEKQALIKYRLERADVTLSDAHRLHQQGGSPASVVNRAYYAMFYASLALLASIDKESTKHQGVIGLFDLHFIKPGHLPKEMSKFLHQAFDTRLAGDYDEEAELTSADALQILESAVAFIKSAKETLSG